MFLGGAGQFQPSRHSMSSQCLNLLSCSQHDGVLLVQNIEPPKLGKVNLPHQIADIQIENLAIAFFKKKNDEISLWYVSVSFNAFLGHNRAMLVGSAILHYM